MTDVYSRRIVVWNVASTLRSDILPLRALDMAAWAAGGHLDGLIHHADHGSNYLAVVYTDRIEELGAKPSTGTVGDSLLTGYSARDPFSRHAVMSRVPRVVDARVQYMSHDGQGSPEARAA